ncbi:putative ribonuclease H-like domain-containing protein [Tanacetum coccineum]
MLTYLIACGKLQACRLKIIELLKKNKLLYEEDKKNILSKNGRQSAWNYTTDDQAKTFEEINLNVVIRSNGQKRYFSTLMTVLSIFDREDLNAVYQLVMEKYQDEMPEGFDKVLWGDLMVMFNPDDENEFWNAQQDWKIVSWKLHGSSGVHTLVTDTGLVIHMLVEKKYPLRKEVLKQMLKLKLESEEESTMALELIKFVKKILTELESEEHKNWLVHKQTACGKDFSNPFMVDNLPKIVGLSTHLASVVKSWLVHDQTVHALASPKANGIFGGNDESKKMQKNIYEATSLKDSQYPTQNGFKVAGGHVSTMRMKKFYRRRDAWKSGSKEVSKTGQKEDSKALVTIDGEGVDWTTHSEDEDYALMACNARLRHKDIMASLSYEYEVLQSDFKGKEECFEKSTFDARLLKQLVKMSVSIPIKEKEPPSFATQQVKTPRETVKDKVTHSQKPKVDKKELGHGFAVRACFVCGSLNHLIRDCDFHEKRMQERLVSMLRACKLLLIFSTARQSVNRQTVLTSTSMKVNTVKHIVNGVRPANLHMNGNKAYLDEFQYFNGGPVAFGGSRGYITGKRSEELFIDVGDSDKEDEYAKTILFCLIMRPLLFFNQFSSQEKGTLMRKLKLSVEVCDFGFIQEGVLCLSSSKSFLVLLASTSKASSTNPLNTASIPVSTASPNEGISLADPTNLEEDDSEIPPLMDYLSTLLYRSTLEAKVIKVLELMLLLAMFKSKRNNLRTFIIVLFECFLSRHEPKKISEALKDESWVDAMQEELLQFDIQKVWILVDLPYGKKAISTKWVYRNKKDERGVVVRNKARLVAQGHRQEERDRVVEVFAPVARLESIRFSEPKHPKKVYKVVKALYGLHQAPRACTPIETQKPLVKVTPKSLPSKCCQEIFFMYLYGQTQLGSFGILEYLHLTWNPTQIVIMLEPILTGNPQQEVVNFLAGDSSLGNAKSRPLWPLLLQKRNPVYHSKTKHIAIRHHFIRDAYEKKLIQVLKIHTDDNVADLLTKAFDISWFQFLVVSIGMHIKGTEEHNKGTEKPNEGIEEPNEGTEEPNEGTEEPNESTDGHKKGTEEEIAVESSQSSSREKEKCVEVEWDVEVLTDLDIPLQDPLLTLMHLPKMDPKVRGKKTIKEEDWNLKVEVMIFLKLRRS